LNFLVLFFRPAATVPSEVLLTIIPSGVFLKINSLKPGYFAISEDLTFFGSEK